MDKQKRVARQEAEDKNFNRLVVWFVVAVIAELVLLLLNRYYIHYRVSEIPMIPLVSKLVSMGFCLGLLFLLVGVIYRMKRWGDYDSSGLIPLAVNGCIFGGAAVSVSFLAVQLYKETAIQILQVMVPVIVVLAMIYYLYQREFFVVSAVSGMAILGMWIYRKGHVGHSVIVYGYLAVLAVLLVAGIALTMKLKKTDGVLELGGKSIEVMPKGASYTTYYVTCAVIAAVVAAVLVMGAAVAYYAIIALAAWIFIMAVYYTAKLM